MSAGLPRRTYSPAEVAEVIGCPRSRVYAWLNNGHLAGRKVGGSWLIPATALAAITEPDAPRPAHEEWGHVPRGRGRVARNSARAA